MKKAIIFDVDGTLLDTERIFMEGWRQAGALFGYTVTEEALLKTRAVQKAVAIPVFEACCGEGFPYEEIRRERVRIAEEIIGASTAEQLRKPDALAVLQALSDRGCALAVASSTRQELTRAHLEHAGLLKFFPVVVTGDMIQRGKPEPDIFLEAARRFGVAPEDCAVVGDTPADVLAGSAAGMDVYLIPDQVPANPQTIALSRRVLENLGQLLGVLEE